MLIIYLYSHVSYENMTSCLKHDSQWQYIVKLYKDTKGSACTWFMHFYNENMEKIRSLLFLLLLGWLVRNVTFGSGVKVVECLASFRYCNILQFWNSVIHCRKLQSLTPWFQLLTVPLLLVRCSSCRSYTLLLLMRRKINWKYSDLHKMKFETKNAI